MKIAAYWKKFQGEILSAHDLTFDPSSEKEQKVILVLNTVEIEAFVEDDSSNVGRPKRDRVALARSFLVKETLGIKTVKDLITYLKVSTFICRATGFEAGDLPCEATFSNAFREFSESKLAEKTHQAMVAEALENKEKIVVCRDSTDVTAREKTTFVEEKEEEVKYGRGRPKKDEARPEKRTVIQQQRESTLEEAIENINICCDIGTKKKLGKTYRWKGYKLHLDVTQGGLPICAILSSASTSDYNVYIPLEKMTSRLCMPCLTTADKGYDSKELRDFTEEMGSYAIIPFKVRRNGDKPLMYVEEKLMLKHRTQVERTFGRLKDNFNLGRSYYSGHSKLSSIINFSLLALTALVIIESS